MNDQPQDGPRYATLGDYLRVVREHALLIAGLALALGAAAFAYSAVQPKEYEASATLGVQEQAGALALLGAKAETSESPQAQTSELATVATRESIAEGTERALDGSLTTDAIRSKVDLRVDVQTNLLIVSATDDDPDFAAELADAYARRVAQEANAGARKDIVTALELVRAQREEAQASGLAGTEPALILEERFNRLQALERIARPVEVVAEASAPGSPVSPKPARNTVFGLLGGLFLGIVLAFVRDSFDTRLKGPREMEDHFGIAPLGQLSEDAFGRVVGSRNGPPELNRADLEATRMIRTNLDFLGGEQRVGSIAVTSPLVGEGKSTVAVALASVSAMSGRRTLLIECDLHHPVLAERLGLDREPGLSDVLLGSAQPRDVLQVVDLGQTADGPEAESKLVCVTAGSQASSPADLLSREGFDDLLGKVTKVYETVVLDTAPVLAVADSRGVLPLVDSVIVCARVYQTTREQADATRKTLARLPVRASGLVVTGVRPSDDPYSHYYGYAQS